ncbi:hypothetical protein ABPG74_022343 [Tetrahymena malaccensis]
MNSSQSLQKQEISDIKQLLNSFKSMTDDTELLAFLIGTQYAYKKIKREELNQLVKMILQLCNQFKSKGQDFMIEQVFSQLINNSEQEPFSYLQNLYNNIEKQMNLKNKTIPFTSEQSNELEESKEEQKSEIWDCDICQEKMTNQEYWPIDCCGSTFHRACLQKYFICQVEQRRFPIKCINQYCPQDVSQQDIREILNDQDFQKYQQYQIQNYIDCQGDQASWCPTPDCQYAFILEDKQSRLNCPNCYKSYCLVCKCIYHENQTCKEYQISNNYSEEDRQFDQLARGKKFKQCSKCKIWVEKNQGCDHMTCRCGYEFCYICGGIYNQCQCQNQLLRGQQENIFNNHLVRNDLRINLFDSAVFSYPISPINFRNNLDQISTHHIQNENQEISFYNYQYSGYVQPIIQNSIFSQQDIQLQQQRQQSNRLNNLENSLFIQYQLKQSTFINDQSQEEEDIIEDIKSNSINEIKINNYKMKDIDKRNSLFAQLNQQKYSKQKKN